MNDLGPGEGGGPLLRSAAGGEHGIKRYAQASAGFLRRGLVIRRGNAVVATALWPCFDYNPTAMTAQPATTLLITDRALAQLRTVAEGEGVDTDSAFLRVAVVPGGCSGLTYDLGWDTVARGDDERLDVGGLTVVMDLKSALYLDGSELDFTDGLDGQGFHFLNPQAARTCACGESFGL